MWPLFLFVNKEFKIIVIRLSMYGSAYYSSFDIYQMIFSEGISPEGL